MKIELVKKQIYQTLNNNDNPSLDSFLLDVLGVTSRDNRPKEAGNDVHYRPIYIPEHQLVIRVMKHIWKEKDTEESQSFMQIFFSQESEVYEDHVVLERNVSYVNKGSNFHRYEFRENCLVVESCRIDYYFDDEFRLVEQSPAVEIDVVFDLEHMNMSSNTHIDFEQGYKLFVKQKQWVKCSPASVLIQLNKAGDRHPLWANSMIVPHLIQSLEDNGKDFLVLLYSYIKNPSLIHLINHPDTHDGFVSLVGTSAWLYGDLGSTLNTHFKSGNCVEEVLDLNPEWSHVLLPLCRNASISGVQMMNRVLSFVRKRTDKLDEDDIAAIREITGLSPHISGIQSLGILLDFIDKGYSVQDINTYLLEVDKYQAVSRKESLTLLRRVLYFWHLLDVFKTRRFPHYLRVSNDLTMRQMKKQREAAIHNADTRDKLFARSSIWGQDILGNWKHLTFRTPIDNDASRLKDDIADITNGYVVVYLEVGPCGDTIGPLEKQQQYRLLIEGRHIKEAHPKIPKEIMHEVEVWAARQWFLVSPLIESEYRPGE